jgi:predicted DNA-binding transcriptional regulator AlpA
MEQQAFSISQFCAAHAISRALFYLLLKDGRAPATMLVGSRRLISAEAAAAWRKKLENAQPGGTSATS